MAVRFVDEHPAGFGWINPEPALMERASHAADELGFRSGGRLEVQSADRPAALRV